MAFALVGGLFVYSAQGPSSQNLISQDQDLLNLRRFGLIKPDKINRAVKIAFNMFDLNHDGEMPKENTVKAIKVIMGLCNIPPMLFNEFVFDQFYERADKNEDGKMSKDEMVSLVNFFIDLGNKKK